MKLAIWILWPSFIVAGAGEAVFFTFIDPMSLSLFDDAHDYSRLTVYSVGFFVFWIFAAASSALTCFFQRSSEEINRCPLKPPERPPGCPKREESDACC